MSLKVEFIRAIQESYDIYRKHGARSDKKLYPLHRCVANHLQNKLGKDYQVYSIGIGDNKEKKIGGRYYPKKVDIAIEKQGKTLGVVEIKFVQSSYKKNSVNYFENMLGQTANIRSKGIKEYQLFILPAIIPLLDNLNNIKAYEKISSHNILKYVTLGDDDCQIYYHTPDKLLFQVIDIMDGKIEESNQLKPNKQNHLIFNDYCLFIDKIYHGIKAL